MQSFESLGAEWRSIFAPATHWLFEWTDIWIAIPGADRLRAGRDWLGPTESGTLRGLFCVRFENQIGLTALQPFRGDQALSAPLHIEVLSRKFPSFEEHFGFFRALLNDLSERAAVLPFALQSPTERGVALASASASPFWTLHFLTHHENSLRVAWEEIVRAPHRDVRDESNLVPFAEVGEAGADVLLHVVQTPDEWRPAQGFALANRLGNRAPQRVWQRQSCETFDTAPNRFVAHLLRELQAAAQLLMSQAWYSNLPVETQARLRRVMLWLHKVRSAPLLAEAGAWKPSHSANRVLEQRRGYREMRRLEALFGSSRRVIWRHAEEAIAVRDIARLYEVWTFFALLEKVATAVGEAPQIDVALDPAQGLQAGSSVRFGQVGTLVYNRATRSYAATLRPDWTWLRNGQADVVFDAKFRLERAAISGEVETSAARADFYKMHAYRDALGVRAAVALYPGDVSLFYDVARSAIREPSWSSLLCGDLHGIGALALAPHNRR